MELYILDLGLIRRFHDRPIAGYLIGPTDGDRAGDGWVLVDTGPPPDAPADGPLQVSAQQRLVAQLAAVGVRPEQVGTVICSHFDPDHAGGLGSFPEAVVVVQRDHLSWVQGGDHGGKRRFAPDPAWWQRPAGRLRLVDGDVEVRPGVRVVRSDGHVPGHQSVLLTGLHGGPVLLAIDAITRAEALDWRTRPMTAWDLDEQACRASTRKLVALAEQHGAAILRGHDPEQWPTLRRAPERYR